MKKHRICFVVHLLLMYHGKSNSLLNSSVHSPLLVILNTHDRSTLESSIISVRTQKSVRDIYLDLRSILEQEEGHFVEDLKKRWKHFQYELFFFSLECEES